MASEFEETAQGEVEATLKNPAMWSELLLAFESGTNHDSELVKDWRALILAEIHLLNDDGWHTLWTTEFMYRLAELVFAESVAGHTRTELMSADGLPLYSVVSFHGAIEISRCIIEASRSLIRYLGPTDLAVQDALLFFRSYSRPERSTSLQRKGVSTRSREARISTSLEDTLEGSNAFSRAHRPQQPPKRCLE